MQDTRNLKVEVTDRGPRGAELLYGIVDVATGNLLLQANGEAFSFATSSSAYAFIEGYAFAREEA
jgi:hypothetical protein